MKRMTSLRERLTTERALFGLQQTHPNPPLAEMAGICGYDFLMLDAEHGVFSEQDYLQTLQALAAVNTSAFVRLAGHDAQAAGRYLDMGVDAILVPNVSTAEQAEVMARAMEYPPSGSRGFGASVHRATRYGLDLQNHLKSPREGVYLIIMIESAIGVSNVDDILAVAGVDGVFIGPSDLSASLGRLKDYTHQTYKQSLERVERATLARGKLLGTAPHAGNPTEALLARGYRLVLLDADMCLIREAMTTQVQEAKACLQGIHS
jgi:4-hydroxy-2-oxoheptanedioate aldolase